MRARLKNRYRINHNYRHSRGNECTGCDAGENITVFDQLCADYKRHGSRVLYPPFWAVCNYRFGNWSLKRRWRIYRWFTSKIYGLNQFLILITSGIELNRETKIGKDLHLIHSGNIMISPKAVIGDRCGIMHEVTIGTNSLPGVKLGSDEQRGSPVIGNDVFIGAGAKVLGGITIGDGAIIGANSLVTVNVPPNCIAIGVPARVMKQRVKRAAPQTRDPDELLSNGNAPIGGTPPFGTSEDL